MNILRSFNELMLGEKKDAFVELKHVYAALGIG